MAALTLNGITITVGVDSVSRKEQEIGEGPSQAYDGSLLRSTQGYKRRWSMKSTPISQDVSYALVQLLQGRVDHWPFDVDLYSDKGLVTTSNTGCTVIAATPTPKWGAGCLNIPAGITNGITYPTALGNYWTAMVWRNESAVWVWYWISYRGGVVAVYRNGVSQAAAFPAWFAFAGSSLRLVGIAGTAFAYDDLVVWSFASPLSWQSQLYAFAQIQAFPLAPAMQLGGDILQATTSATVQGVPGAIRDTIGNLNDGNGYVDNLEPLEFDLQES